MKRLFVGIIAAAVLVTMARTAMAQAKTIRSEMRTETGIVETIDAATRVVTLKKADGTVVAVVAGPDIARFAELKVGDKVTARYYENVVVRVKRPGEPDVDQPGEGHDWFRTGPAWWHQSQADDDHRHDLRHRHGRPVDHLHRAERLEVHVQGAGHGSSGQGESRRQGRHRLDRSDAGVARARSKGSADDRGDPL